MTHRRLRVCVVDPRPSAPAFPRLDECEIDVVGALQGVNDALRAPIDDHDAVVVGATAAQLRDVRFQSRLARLARRLPTVLVVPRITRHAAVVAATARVAGLVVRDAPPAAFMHALRGACRGEVVYPSEAVARLLPLVPVARG